MHIRTTYAYIPICIYTGDDVNMQWLQDTIKKMCPDTHRIGKKRDPDNIYFLQGERRIRKPGVASGLGFRSAKVMRQGKPELQ